LLYSESAGNKIEPLSEKGKTIEANLHTFGQGEGWGRWKMNCWDAQSAVKYGFMRQWVTMVLDMKITDIE